MITVVDIRDRLGSPELRDLVEQLEYPPEIRARKTGEIIKEYQEHPDQLILGAEANGELVGFIGLRRGPPSAAVIRHLAVRRDHRGEGVARQAIRRICEIYQFREVSAETDRDAVGFYRRVGFAVESLGEKYPGTERFLCRLAPGGGNVGPDDHSGLEPRPNLYRTDLAYIHDAGFGDVARNGAALLVERLGRDGIRDGTVVDLGCGSGIGARLLCDAGFDVVGIDASEAMIRMARTRVPEAELRVGSWVTAEIPPCVAVTAIGEVLGYIGGDHPPAQVSLRPCDHVRSSAARAGLWARIHAALAPGGLLLFDLAGPGRAPTSSPQRTFTEGPDWTVLVEAEADAARSLLTRRITTFRKVGELYRRDHEVHRLELIDPADVGMQLLGAGLSVQMMDGYGAHAALPGLAVFMATKVPDRSAPRTR